VKILYEDAMKDELLMKYLPTKEQLSGRLPERDIFFGLMCTMRNQYIEDIVAGAHKARYTVAEDDTKKKALSILEAWWMAELQKHPYHSSKLLLLILVEKSGTGIFLMKDSAKFHRPQNEREKKKLAKRLWEPSEARNDEKKQVEYKTIGKIWEEDSSQRYHHQNRKTH
jgi:hypothetical protein